MTIKRYHNDKFSLFFLFPQVLEQRIPFLMASVKDLQHFVPNTKDSKVSVIGQGHLCLLDKIDMKLFQ